MTVPGYLVEVQTRVGLWVAMYATPYRHQLGEFVERMAVPEEGAEEPKVIRISRILIDDGATQ